MLIKTNDILNIIKKSDYQNYYVFFDLDSTIYNLSSRQIKIFKDFANDHKEVLKFKDISEKILSARFSEMPYYPIEALKHLGIVFTDEFKTYYYQYWQERFFSNDYLFHDTIEPGVLEFINKLNSYSTQVIFLTGRDKERMGKGTREKMLQDGLLDDRHHLILKPNKDLEDRDYKLDIVRSYNSEDRHIIFIDNEASNVNHIYQNHPEHTTIFYDSIHSGREEPSEKLYILQSFS